jgi:hypothetical protein
MRGAANWGLGARERRRSQEGQNTKKEGKEGEQGSADSPRRVSVQQNVTTIGRAFEMGLM